LPPVINAVLFASLTTPSHVVALLNHIDDVEQMV
jgi:hypothetical protein